MTKRICALLAVAALLTAGTALAGDWTGEVVEMSCYTRNGSTGEDHAACAKTCLNKIDLEKAADIFVLDYRKGKHGRVSLEAPNSVPK